MSWSEEADNKAVSPAYVPMIVFTNAGRRMKSLRKEQYHYDKINLLF